MVANKREMRHEQYAKKRPGRGCMRQGLYEAGRSTGQCNSWWRNVYPLLGGVDFRNVLRDGMVCI